MAAGAELVLGLDLGTQSLSATLLDPARGAVAHRFAVGFGDDDLKRYRSPEGFLPDADPTRRHADPRMWAEALDLLFARAVAAGVDLSRIVALSGAAQQHGTVYVAAPLRSVEIGPGEDLAAHVGARLSRPTAPIWLDSSSARECAEIAAALGGPEEVRAVSGSVPTERFSGPQIRRFARLEPDLYEATESICLVSSFAASLLLGRPAPIDLADAAGTNLLDLRAGSWSPALLAATAPGLGPRLGEPVPAATVLGEISPYFVTRYGFRPSARVVAWSGDNPTSAVGLGLFAAGEMAVSLGTSDTAFAPIDEPRPAGAGSVFGHPAGHYIGIDVHSNGSLAREEVRRRTGYDWDGFARAVLEETEPGNGGRLMLPYFEPETSPLVEDPRVVLRGERRFREWGMPAAAARAVLEAQALALRAGSRWIAAPDRLTLTGGAAGNRALQQVLADVFGVPVWTMPDGGSVALGAAIRAAEGTGMGTWAELGKAFLQPALGRPAAHPAPGLGSLYEELERRYVETLADELGVQVAQRWNLVGGR